MSCADNQSTVTITKREVLPLPDELTYCSLHPKVPSTSMSGKDVGVFLLELSSALTDCQRTIMDINTWLNLNAKP